MIANYHAHTFRCHHADGTEREYIEKAIAEGLKTFGFSDHVPMPFPDGHQSGFRVPIELLNDYYSTLFSLKEEYRDRIEILIGFEAEYYPAHFEDMLRLLDPYDYDYLILGQHFCWNEEREYNASPVTDKEKLTQYVNQTLEGLRTGKYTYFAHPDILNFVGDSAFYEREMHRLCRGTAELKIPLEVNLLGIQGSRNYPSDRFFRIAVEEKNEFIVGCDSHHVADVANRDVLAMGDEFCRRNGIVPLDKLPALRNPHVLNSYRYV